jgi:hypothetical protein
MSVFLHFLWRECERERKAQALLGFPMQGRGEVSNEEWAVLEPLLRFPRYFWMPSVMLRARASTGFMSLPTEFALLQKAILRFAQRPLGSTASISSLSFHRSRRSASTLGSIDAFAEGLAIVACIRVWIIPSNKAVFLNK